MEIICEKTYCELNLTTSHDVIQEGIHFDDLSGKIWCKFNTGCDKRGVRWMCGDAEQQSCYN